MLLNRETWKLHRPWALLFALGLVGSLLSLYRWADGWLEFPGGSSTIGYTLGVVAGLIIVFEVLLWPRKKLLRRWRLGRLRTWMAAHLWLGLLTVPLAIVHAGIPWGGSLASATMVLLLLVVGSGIFGLVMQQMIPTRMIQVAPNETIYSQIEHFCQQLVIEADALVSATVGRKVGTTDWSEVCPADKGHADGVRQFVGASRTIANALGNAIVCELPKVPLANTSMLAQIYETTIRDYLAATPSKSSVLDDERGQERFFRELSTKVSEEVQPIVQQLQNWCNQRLELKRQSSLHHWLHLWLAIHLPLSLGLLVLLIWHAIVASKYSGIFSFF